VPTLWHPVLCCVRNEDSCLESGRLGFADERFEHRAIPRSRETGHIFESKTISPSLGDKTEKVVKEEPALVRTRAVPPWPCRILALRPCTSKCGVVAVFSPERCLRERLAGWPADNDQRISSAEVGLIAKILPGHHPDIGPKHLTFVVAPVCAQRFAYSFITVD
jgi:hypothetical protein